MRHGHMIKGQQGRNDASSLSHHLLRERVIIIIILSGPLDSRLAEFS